MRRDSFSDLHNQCHGANCSETFYLTTLLNLCCVRMPSLPRQVVYGRYDKVEEDSKEKGWNLLLSNESDLTESYGIYPLLARQWKGTKRSRLSDLILTPLLAYRDLVYCAERWEDWKELQW